MNAEELAKKCRIDILNMVSEKRVGFVGSAFSCIDILAVLYTLFVNVTGDAQEDEMVILSKGHAASAWYAILANIGIIDKGRLNEFNDNGFCLGVHSKRGSIPGIYATSGSLGQGLGMACGCALADKIKGRNKKTYVVLGDGECNEGAVWEGFMFAARYQLNNLVAIIDRNRLQSYGTDQEVMNLDDIGKKCKEFKWNVYEINGHSYQEIENALSQAGSNGQPTIIVANTVKGKGVSEFENGVIWHYKWPEGESYRKAMEELTR